jgi:hypothetical protein
MSPGGTFSVDSYAGGDVSQMQVVMVFHLDEEVDVGTDYVYTFPVGDYEDSFGDVRETRSFEYHGVTAGDYLVYAFLDYDGDGVYESPWPDYEVSWTYGDPNYSIDTSGTPVPDHGAALPSGPELYGDRLVRSADRVHPLIRRCLSVRRRHWPVGPSRYRSCIPAS